MLSKLLTVVTVMGVMAAEYAVAQTTPDAASIVRMLQPGFTVRELPIRLTSLNNVEYASDGRLFAAGYDGRFHLLRDTDGDGLEDQVQTFESETSSNYPLGLVVKNGEPYAVLADEVIRFRDTNHDGLPDQREVVAQGFDDPWLKAAPYLNHRRVDAAMALALAPDGSIYLTMGNAGYNNAYWHDKTGTPNYSPDQRRGCLLKISPDGQVEQLASGLRYIMSLQWNRHGDLFGTDQEGATWVPNGNPADELLHLLPGRHYGFPPRHPKFLPNVIDEPSVWDYAPQHQSTCGFRFNGPAPGRGCFGPSFWADDALVTGESRGKLWRTALAKTAAGYVARTQLIACVGMLVVDCAVSPPGDLVICCHSGRPDWGNGPQGAGRVFKISYADRELPQPTLIWPATETETVLAFDRELDEKALAPLLTKAVAESGKYVAAADRWELDRPGYAVVEAQQRQARQLLRITSAQRSSDRSALILKTEPRTAAVNYAFTLNAGSLDLAHDLTGVAAEWTGADGKTWNGWLPHPDFAASQVFTRSSATHAELWWSLGRAGALTLRTQLDLFNMLQPATQPGSKLDYVPAAESVTVVFQGDAALSLTANRGNVHRVSAQESHLQVEGPESDVWTSLELKLATPARRLDVSFLTTRDSQSRTLATRRFLVPFARPPAADTPVPGIPELAEGNWHAGRDLYRGKCACQTCHAFRGEGHSFGPDLSNLRHREYASVKRDLLEPSAVINPDAVGYLVRLDDGTTVSGTRHGETEHELQLTQPGGAVVRLEKAHIEQNPPARHLAHARRPRQAALRR